MADRNDPDKKQPVQEPTRMGKVMGNRTEKVEGLAPDENKLEEIPGDRRAQGNFGQDLTGQDNTEGQGDEKDRKKQSDAAKEWSAPC